MSKEPRMIKSDRDELNACEELLKAPMRAMAWKLRSILRYAVKGATDEERERCAQVAEAAADEWWKSLKARDEGLEAVDFGPLTEHIAKKIRAPIQEPADRPAP